MQKGDLLYLAVLYRDQSFQATRGQESELGGDEPFLYRVVAELSFVGNRKFSTEKIFSFASDGDCGLPFSSDMLASVREDLGIKKEYKTYHVWEVELQTAHEVPVNVPSATAPLDPSASSFEGAVIQRLKPSQERDKCYDHGNFDNFDRFRRL